MVRMRKRNNWGAWWGVAVIAALHGCGGPTAEPVPADIVARCAVDEDGDGYGLGCPAGDDCNDSDPSVQEGCLACAVPQEGCPCEPSTTPESCFTQKLLDERTLLCATGMRYCQDGVYTECLGLTSFEEDVSWRLSGEGFEERRQALLPEDAGTESCSPCRPNCYPVNDHLEPVDGGLLTSNSSDTTWGDNGGITITSTTLSDPVVIGPVDDCQLGVAPDSDCDGVPDEVDEAVGPNVPFGTTAESIYMDLAPGEQESAYLDLQFYLRSADVYFLLDGTESMSAVHAPLASAMTSGSFLAEPDAVTCADTDGDGLPNEELKTAGIAGNIACVVRNGAIGAGWVREIPFLGPDADGIMYGDVDEHMFEQRSDIGASAADVSSAIASFTTNPNYGGPDGQIAGLYLTTTGAESYVGWNRPGVPRRWSCPTGTFGYPCFRSTAVPIVALFTANPMYNGPATLDGHLGSNGLANYPLTYPSAIHTSLVRRGTYPHYIPVDNLNETFISAYDIGAHLLDGQPIGAITNDLVTFSGDTRAMVADINAALLNCDGLTQAEGADAAFLFTVDQGQTLTVSTRGTRFENVLGLIKQNADGTTPTSYTLDLTTSVNPDGTPTNDSEPAELGELPSGISAVISGTTESATGQYTRETLGCYDHAAFDNQGGNDSSDYGPDVLFNFTLAQDMDLYFQAAEGTYWKSLSLFEGRPNLAQWTSGTLGDTNMDYVVQSGERIDLDAFDMHNNAVRLITGYTGEGTLRTATNLSTVGLTGDFPDTLFASAGCNPVSEYSPDTVVDFQVTEPTRVRIETSGDANKMSADFVHMIGLYRRGIDPVPIDQTAPVTNEDVPTALEIPEANFKDSGWARVSGTVQIEPADPNLGTSAVLMRADYTQDYVGGTSGCGLRGGGESTSPDAVFQFTLTETRTLEFNTHGSLYRTYLSLHRDRSLTSTNTNETQASALFLGSLDSQVVTVSGSTTAMRSDYGKNVTSCRSTSTPPDAVYRFRLERPTQVEISTIGGASWDTVLALYDGDGVSVSDRITCNDDSGGTLQSTITADLSAGEYYVVLTGYSDYAFGGYSLTFKDKTNQSAALSRNLVSCDSGSMPGDPDRSKIIETLGPGTYYLIVKSDSSQTLYDYVVNVIDLQNAALPDSLIACGYRNYDTGLPGGSNLNRAYIEQDLQPGKYSVVMRGSRAADGGEYRMIIRDVEFLPTFEACHDNKTGFSTSFSYSLPACQDGYTAPCPGYEKEYWLVMRGFNAGDDEGGSGPYTLFIRDRSLGTPIDVCGTTGVTGDFTGHLDAGNYIAVVKGIDAADEGWYQLSVGDTTLATGGDYTDLASWTGGVQSALQAAGVRVVGVQFGADAYLNEQLKTVASSTQAVSITNQPLVVQLNPADPNLSQSLGTAVVGAVRELALAMRMDVGVRLDPAPDYPSPMFQFAAQAIDLVGDGCEPPINNVHQNCEPGATPKFQVTFGNPVAPDNVPLNPNDPNGGYWMTLQLVGDGRYIVEQIPVYLIPQDVTAEPTYQEYDPQGAYWQDFGSPNCFDGERPDWNSLSWNATIPPGTSIVWSVCTAEDMAGLETCQLAQLAAVTGGAACTADTDCPHGYCAFSGVCEYAVGPSCESAEECGVGGDCVLGACRFLSLPVDPQLVLPQSHFGLPYMRVRADMYASPDLRAAPTIYDWRVEYDCIAAE